MERKTNLYGSSSMLLLNYYKVSLKEEIKKELEEKLYDRLYTKLKAEFENKKDDVHVEWERIGSPDLNNIKNEK